MSALIDPPSDPKLQTQTHLAAFLASTTNGAIGAELAYEMGEIWSRADDRPKAIAMFMRAIQIDPHFHLAKWALRRMLYRDRRWRDVTDAIARDLMLAGTAELHFEAAHATLASGDLPTARNHLADVLGYDHAHLGALLELENLALESCDNAEIARAWLALSAAATTLGWKCGYAVAAAHLEPLDANAVLDRVAEIAENDGPWRTQITRTRVALSRSTTALDHALGALTRALPSGPARTAVRIRHARLVRANSVVRALELAPPELPSAERLELVAEVRLAELAPLVTTWTATETAQVCREQIARWTIDALGGGAPWVRELLAAIQRTTPSTSHLTSFAECGALASANLEELAHAYFAAAKQIQLGEWSADELSVDAAVAFAIQAAWLYSVFGGEAGLGLAVMALQHARQLDPESAPVREVGIEISEQLGDVGEALALLRVDEPTTDPKDLERAIRIASYHDRDGLVVSVLRKLVDARPDDLHVAWRLESELRFAEDKDEHANLFLRLVETDRDTTGRGPLLLTAARLASERGDVAAAASFYRAETATRKGDVASDELRVILRRGEQWEELISDLLARARREGIRADFHEAASIVELTLDSPERAFELYREWHIRAPADLTALSGFARLAERVGDRAAACEAYEKLAVLSGSPESRWLWARSLVAIGKRADAKPILFALSSGEDSVLAKSAALASLEIELESHDRAGQTKALELVALRSSDPKFGATLLATAGWTHLVANRDYARGDADFAAAIALQPDHASARFGRLFAAMGGADHTTLGDAYVSVARLLKNERAAAAFYLRAANIAVAEGRASVAIEHSRAAVAIAPSDDSVVVAVADEEPVFIPGVDPFAPNEAMVDRAKLLELRVEMTTEPNARREWRLECALAHELADQPIQACEMLALILDEDSGDWRALAALRRIARHVKDEASFAAASIALSQASADRSNRLHQLRDAADVFDRTSSPFALIAYREIATLDPTAPEVERYFKLLRDSRDGSALLRAVTARLAQLEKLAGHEDAMVQLLDERAQLLIAAGHRELAIADLDAVLEHAPADGDALHQRAALAYEANDNDRAIVLWWRYLALDSPPFRDEVEALISRVQDREASAADINEDTHDSFDPESTKSDLLATEIALNTMVDAYRLDLETAPRRTASIIRRTPIETEPVQHVDIGSTTARVDLSTLVEQERIQRPDNEYDLEITSEGHATRAKTPISKFPANAEITLRSAIEAAVGAGDVQTMPTRVPLCIPVVDVDKVLPPAVALSVPSVDPRKLERPAAMGFSEDSDIVMVSLRDLQPLANAEATVAMLREVEREIACSPACVALHCEAGRLSLQLDDLTSSRAHFDRALAVDSSAAHAMRGLRRIARREANLAEVVSWLDAEIADATGRERDAFARYRIELLLAVDECDLARIAVGEQLDHEPGEPDSLITQALLCFLDDRMDELRSVLTSAKQSEPSVRDGLRMLGILFGVADDPSDQKYELHYNKLAAAIVTKDAATRARALFELACHVEGEDPEMAAALAIQAQRAGAPSEIAINAAQLAARAATRDTFVARTGAETARRELDAKQASQYFARWARLATGVDRGYAAAFAATTDPKRFERLWTMVVEVDSTDTHAVHRQRALDGNVDPRTSRELDLDDLLGKCGWTELSKIVDEMTIVDLRTIRFRAHVLHRRARTTDAPLALSAALDAWIVVLSHDPQDSVAQGAALRVAKRLGPAAELSVIAQVHAADSDPWARSSLAVAYAVAAHQLGIAHTIGDDALDDPRRTLADMIRAASKSDLVGCARALAARAKVVGDAEARSIRQRAAALALVGNDVAYASSLVDEAHDAYELRAALDERAGLSRPDPPTNCSDLTVAYNAQRAHARGHYDAAIRLYRRLLSRALDPLLLSMCVDAARAAGSADALIYCALTYQKLAEERGYGIELLAEAQRMRGDRDAEARTLKLAYESQRWRFDLGLRYTRALAELLQAQDIFAFRLNELRSSALDARDLFAGERGLAMMAMRLESGELESLSKRAHDAEPDNVLAAIMYDVTLAKEDAARLAFEERIASRSTDPRVATGFWVRAGRTAEHLGDWATAMSRYRDALAINPTYHAAIVARYSLAAARHEWRDLADAAIAMAGLTHTPGPHHYVAGMVLMDHLDDRDAAIVSLQNAVTAMLGHRDAFIRLRALLLRTARERELAELVDKRIAHETDQTAKVELMRWIAEHDYIVGAYDAAADRYRALVLIDPADARAHAALVELASDARDRITTAIRARLAIERDPMLLGALHHRLGTVEVDPAAAKRSFELALENDPSRISSLHLLQEIAVTNRDWDAAIITSERISALETDPALRARNFYRTARALINHRDTVRAKQMIAEAVAADPANLEGLATLVELTRDKVFLSEQLDRIASAMRERITANPRDAVAYCALSRALTARREEIVTGAPPAARAAAELALLFGGGSDLERELLATPSLLDRSRLSGPTADNLLFADASQPELRQVLAAFGDAIAKLVGPDPFLRSLGRKDRVSVRDPIYSIAREVAGALGIAALNVYVSSRPYGMSAEPTSPITLVLGRTVAEGPADRIRFATAAALKLAQVGLAVPTRLGIAELSALCLGVVRIFQPTFVAAGISEERVAMITTRLDRSISSDLRDQLSPVAQQISEIDVHRLARDLRIVGLRAGFAAAGSVLPGLETLAVARGADVREVVTDAVGFGLIRFALI